MKNHIKGDPYFQSIRIKFPISINQSTNKQTNQYEIRYYYLNCYRRSCSICYLRTVTLKTFGYPPPQYPEVTGKSVSAWHEGAGINYLLIAEPATKFTYDEESKHLYFEGGQGPNGPLKWYFTIGDGEPGIYKLTQLIIQPKSLLII